MTAAKDNKLADMRKGFAKIFAKYFPEDIASTLAEAHVLWHIQFVHELAGEESPALQDKIYLRNHVEHKVVARLRRARAEDAFPKGMNETLLMDEIIDFVQSAGVVRMGEIQALAVAMGTDAGFTRAAVLELLKLGRLRRVGGGAGDPNARFECVPEKVNAKTQSDEAQLTSEF